MHDLQALGEALVALPDARIAALGLEERLVAAVEAYRRTRTHEGRRRQMQYVGKLMRLADAEPIREAVAAMQLGRAHDSLALHEAERWRAELLADDEALARWREAHPRHRPAAAAQPGARGAQGRRRRARGAQRARLPRAVPLHPPPRAAAARARPPPGDAAPADD